MATWVVTCFAPSFYTELAACQQNPSKMNRPASPNRFLFSSLDIEDQNLFFIFKMTDRLPAQEAIDISPAPLPADFAWPALPSRDPTPSIPSSSPRVAPRATSSNSLGKTARLLLYVVVSFLLPAIGCCYICICDLLLSTSRSLRHCRRPWLSLRVL